mgnify:CR=1 FL=1
MAKKRNQLETLEQLGYKLMPIKKLVKADWNYKEEEDNKSKKLLNNFKRNGQLENILVRLLDTGYYEVVNGNHRLDVMNTLGYDNVVVMDLGEITQQEAIRKAIETNETKFVSDTIKLAELLGELTEEFGQEEIVNSLPYNADELNNFANMLNFNWEQFEEDGSLLDKGDSFDKEIKLKVTEETYNVWIRLKEKLAKLNGYDNESKVFEFAIIEALNIPDESLQ